jgi:hypothetical protein
MMAPLMSMLGPQRSLPLASGKDPQRSREPQYRATAFSQTGPLVIAPSFQHSPLVAAAGVNFRAGCSSMPFTTHIQQRRLSTPLQLRAAAQATESATDQAKEDDSSSPLEGENSTALGPAFQATLQMLEWPRICAHLADFASTAAGKRACQRLLPPAATKESEQELALTR